MLKRLIIYWLSLVMFREKAISLGENEYQLCMSRTTLNVRSVFTLFIQFKYPLHCTINRSFSLCDSLNILLWKGIVGGEGGENDTVGYFPDVRGKLMKGFSNLSMTKMWYEILMFILKIQQGAISIYWPTVSNEKQGPTYQFESSNM